MAVPDFQSMLLPLLKVTAEHAETTTADAYSAMAKQFPMTSDELAEMLPSGRANLFRNRVAWAKQYLMYAGLVEPLRRGVSRATPLGKKWASERSAPLKIRDFKALPGFSERVHGEDAPPEATQADAPSQAATPDERIETAYKELRHAVVANLLLRIGLKPPVFFEQLVIKLMAKLGYGDGTPESMLHTGQTNDGGIDGKIKMDVLGVDHIFLQAKRYEPGATISREQVAAFAGSIAGAKGVFVTTSTFSKQASDFVRVNHRNIVLIDGQKLGELMLRAGLGVSVKKSYDVYAIDEELFTDEE
jgi:restriction system protein